MALVTKHTERIDFPHEPGSWADIRVPLSAGDLGGLTSSGSEIRMSLDLMASVVTGWSYEEPVTPNAINRLDLDTYALLAQEIFRRSGVRDDEEKKDSASSSSPSTAPDTASSPASSGG